METYLVPARFFVALFTAISYIMTIAPPWEKLSDGINDNFWGYVLKIMWAFAALFGTILSTLLGK